MRSDVRSRPFNFAAQVLAGGEATLVRTPQRRFRIKGEDDEEPAALVEPEDRPRPSVADEPLHPVVLRNRAKIAALRRERVWNAPLELGDLLRTRDGLFLAFECVGVCIVIVLRSAALARMVPGVAGLFCPCVLALAGMVLYGVAVAIACVSVRAVLLLLAAAPRRAGGEGEIAKRLRAHLDAVARRLGRDVAPAADDDRVDEVLVELVDVLDDAVLERAAEDDVV